MHPDIINQLKQLNTKEFTEGQLIFSEGDEAEDTMYFILSGLVGFYKSRPEGAHEIERMGPGSFFGEMALVGNQRRMAAAKALAPGTKIILLNKAIFLKLCGSNPPFVLGMLKYAVSRLLAAEDRLQKVKEEKNII